MFYLLTKHALHNAGVTDVLAYIVIGVSGTTRTVWYNGITLGWFHHVVDWGFHAHENPNCTYSRKHERDKVSKRCHSAGPVHIRANRGMMLAHDNAPCHSASNAQAMCVVNNVLTLQWPSKSPV